MRKFYIASSFKNKHIVRNVSKHLKSRGFIQTYDWTNNERASTYEELKEIGQYEKNAVIEADFIIVLLPAGKGSHIELGIALGRGKKVYIHSSSAGMDNFETTSTFYFLPEVRKLNGTTKELVEVVTKEIV